MRSPFVGVLLGVSLVLGSVALAGVLHRPDEGSEKATTASAFRVRSKVRGLYPGRVKTIKATVRNRSSRRIYVKRITARVTSPSAACPASAIRVRPWRGSLVLRPGAKRHVRLRIRMRPWAPNACQGVRFHLRYHGKATLR